MKKVILILLLFTSCRSHIILNGIEVKPHHKRQLKPRDIGVIAGLVGLGIHLGTSNNLNKKP